MYISRKPLYMLNITPSRQWQLFIYDLCRYSLDSNITERKYKGKKIIAIVNVSEDNIFLKKYVNKNDLLSRKRFNGNVESYGSYIIYF